MKNLILSIISLLFFTTIFAQKSEVELERDRLYQDYVQFKDTMTSRTWINMVNLSNKLEAVVLFDNLMLDSVKMVSPGHANFESRILELSKIRDQIIQDNARLNQELSKAEKSRSNFLIIAVISAFLLIVIATILVVIRLRYQKMVLETENHNENILKLKHNHKEEMDLLKDQIEEFAGEKELLENNAVEMKKSFDILKSELASKSVKKEEDAEIEQIRKEMEELGTELSKLMEERDGFEEALGMANLKLAHQMDKNEKFETDLEKLLGQFRGKVPEDQEES